MLFLVAAYRSLGGAAAPPADTRLLLRSLHRQLLASIASLRATLAAADDRADASGVAGDGRKLSAAVQQSLDRLPDAAELDQQDATVKGLLGAAAEDTAWAWRMLQAHALSPAVSAAAAMLADHAATCCEQATPLLGPVGEPRDRP